MGCVNLQERFGHRYRIGWEADGVPKPQWPKEDWPWLMEIRCRYGLIYPYGGELLQACSYGSRIGAKLQKLPCVLHAKGREETVIRFHVDDIEQVFGVLKPYKRRRLSEAQRRRKAEILARARLQIGRKRLSAGHFAGPESTRREGVRAPRSSLDSFAHSAARSRRAHRPGQVAAERREAWKIASSTFARPRQCSG